MTRPACLLLLVLSGCGDPAANPDASDVDSATPADLTVAADMSAPPDLRPAADMAACNSTPQIAQPVTSVRVAANAPTATGGPIQTGTYAATAATIYTGAGGATGPTTDTARYTAVFGATTYDAVIEAGGMTIRQSGTWSTAPPTLTVVQLCPTPGNLPYNYTATGGTLNVYIAGSTSTTEITFVRQP